MSKKQVKQDVVTPEESPSQVFYPVLRKSTTFFPSVEDFETSKGESLTVPEATMDMRTIYDRYVSGRTVDANISNSVYHMDENGNPIEMPNLAKLDLVEIGEMLENTRENRDLLEHQLDEERRIINQLEAEKVAKEKAAEDERLLALYEKRRKANEL